MYHKRKIPLKSFTTAEKWQQLSSMVYIYKKKYLNKSQVLVSEFKEQGLFLECHFALLFTDPTCMYRNSLRHVGYFELQQKRRERFRVVNNKVTSSQSNSRNALNITDSWDLTVREDLKGDFSFNVAANNIINIKSELTTATLLPPLWLPTCHILKQALKKVFFLFSVFVLFLQTTDMSFAISVLKLPLYLSSCCFLSNRWFFCLIYWFHCTNVLLFCVSYFTQWPLGFLTSSDTCFLLFFKCVTFCLIILSTSDCC